MRKNQCPAEGPWEDPLLPSRACLDAFPPFLSIIRESLVCGSHFTKWPQFPGLAPAPAQQRPSLPLWPSLTSPPAVSQDIAPWSRERAQGPRDRTNDKRHSEGAPCAAPGSGWEARASPRAEASPPRPRGRRLRGDRPSRLRLPPRLPPRRALWPASRPKPGRKRHLALAARHSSIVPPGPRARPPVGGQWTGVKGAGGGPGSREHKTRKT